MLLAGGVVIQTTSCASFGAEVAYGLTTSIASEFIRNLITDAFGVSTGFGGFF